ncbi:MAG: serine protease [Oceanicoccus sp.]|jgi:serine protease
MKKFIVKITAVCSLFFAGDLLAQSNASNSTNRMIIKYKTQSLNQSASFSLSEPGTHQQALRVVTDVQTNLKSKASYVRGSAKTNVHVVKLDKMYDVAELKSLAQTLKNDNANIEYAEPDYRMFPFSVTPNDTYYQEFQWSFHDTFGINMPKAWEITTGSEDVVVAVIDSGILKNHMDFSSARLLDGYDFMSAIEGNLYYAEMLYQAGDGDGRDADSSDVGDWVDADDLPESMKGSCEAEDSSWHGSHVAGTIGAEANDDFGVAGVDWKAKILPVRVLGRCGGYTSDIAEAILWAAGGDVTGVPKNVHPANVINLSLGGGDDYCPKTFQRAISEAQQHGAFVVAAAGNDNINAAGVSPANCAGVFTVGASQRSGMRSGFSNFGSHVDILAPGGSGNGCKEDIPSTVDSSPDSPAEDSAHACYPGTSMATPHVAGVASLMIAANPDLTPSQISAALKSSARSHVDSSCGVTRCGAGLLDAHQALLDVKVPTAASDLIAVNDGSKVDLSWKDTSEYEKGFNIYRSKNNSVFELIATRSANTQSYTDNNLIIGEYEYKLIAVNGIWASDDSNTVKANVSLYAPNDLSGSYAKSQGVSIKWLDSKNYGVTYIIERAVADGEFVELTRHNTLHFTDNNTLDGMRYRYRVKSFIAEQSSDYTNELEVISTMLNPNISYIQKKGQGAVLYWSDNSESESRYEIERSRDGINFTTIGSVNADVTSYKDNNIQSSVQYFYRVRAVNEHTQSSYSAVIEFIGPSGSSGGAVHTYWLWLVALLFIRRAKRG